MAEQAANLVTGFQSQFQNFYQNLTLSKKIFFFGSIASVLIGIIAFVLVSQQVTWAPLVNGLGQNDAARITQKLDELNVKYVLQPGGTGILVPAAEVDKVRLQIASSGLQMGGLVGLELFDKSNFGATEFQQKIQYKRAMEGELSRLINLINVVRSSKVALAIPEKSLFIDDKEEATASVILEMDGGRKLSAKGVNTILNLVSGAIPGMSVENVRLADQSGRLLSKGENEASGSDSLNKTYGFQRQMEQRLEQKLVSQLEKITGKDRVEVRVTVEVDFDSSQIIEDWVDPDRSALLSEEVSSENATGSRSIPVGVPGVTSNSPEVRAGASEVANVSDITKKQKRRNFVNSKTHTERIHSPGAVKRMSTSVLLDGKYEFVRDEEGEIIGSPIYKPWSPQELQTIEQVAQQAVGYNVKRGDTITVKNLRFMKPLVEQEKLKLQKRDTTRRFIVDLVKYIMVGIVIVALIFLIIRPMVQKLAAKPADLDLLMGLPTTIGELEGEELEIPTEKETGIPSRDKIVEIAKQDPMKTASLVRAWLREKKGP